MRGEVEVYRVTKEGESLVSKSSNLIMDGFGESFVDILTTPSSIVINGFPGQGDNFDDRLDTSNYTIGSIAFGKGTLGFTKNSHDVKNTNLLGFSENLVANFSGNPLLIGNWRSDNQVSCNATSSDEVASDLSSNTIKLDVSAGSTSRHANRVVQFVSSKPLGELYDSLVFSVDFKFNFESPSQPCDADNNRYSALSISQTSSYAAPSEILNQRFNIIKWNASGEASLLSAEEDPNGDFSHGYLQELGNGWYRLSCVLEPARRQVLPSVDTLDPYWTPVNANSTRSTNYFGHPYWDDSDYLVERLSAITPSTDYFTHTYGTAGVDVSSVIEGYGANSEAEFSVFVQKNDGHVRIQHIAFTTSPTTQEPFDITFSSTNGEIVTTTASSTNHLFEYVDYSDNWGLVKMTMTDTAGDKELYRNNIFPYGNAASPSTSAVVWSPKLHLRTNSGYIESVNSDIRATIHPVLPIEAKALSGSDRLNLTVDPSDVSGSVFIARASLNYGTAPSIYVPTSGYDNDFEDDPLMGSSVPVGITYYGASGIGTLYYDSSAYQPVSNPPRIPNPKDSKLEYNVRIPVDSYKDYEVDIDKNLNYLGFPYHEPTLKGVTKSEAIDGFGLRGDARHFGAYCPSAGATIAVLSSVDNTGFINPVSSFEYSAGVNHPDRRTMDKNGHINAYYPLRGDTQDAYGRLIVSANTDFSSTGELSCICIIPSGDAAVANMYGGIFEAGLYSMDFYGNMSNLNYNTLPFSKNVDNANAVRENDAVYKLIAKKTFNDNIVVSRDNGDDAGVAHHDNIKLVWKLKFL